MLDLLISYINFLILSISYIVTKFAFYPPDPPKYKIIKNPVTQEEDIHLLVKDNNNYEIYKPLKTKIIEIEFSKIINDNKSIPILKITPLFHLSICLIFCGGNSGDLGTTFFECYEMSLKFNCIIITFEYPGYGICKDEEIKESEFYKRIQIVYNYVINTLNFKPQNIILCGFSLGTGIVFDLACRKEYPVAGLILISPILSIVRTFYNIKKTKYFDLFNNCDKVKNLRIKTLFIHGNCDTIVPYIHGRILAELMHKEYLYDFLTVKGSNHNDIFKKKHNKKKIFQYINEFIMDCINNNSEFLNLNDIPLKINIFEEKNKDNIDKMNDLRTIESNEKSILNKYEENKTTLSTLENEQDDKKIKAKSSYNFNLYRKLESNNNNILRNDIMKNNRNKYKIFSQEEKEKNYNQSYKNKKIKIFQNNHEKDNLSNYPIKYYHVNIGTNNNPKNKKYNNIRYGNINIAANEKSTTSMYSSTNEL